MEKRIALILLLMVSTFVSAKNDWKGKVVDEKGEPVAYANVAVLSPVDSNVVCGAVTEEDGSFHIVTDVKDGIMMVVMLGYQTQYLRPVDGVLVRLVEDAAMLEGAVVSAVMPKTKLTGEGLQTMWRRLRPDPGTVRSDPCQHQPEYPAGRPGFVRARPQAAGGQDFPQRVLYRGYSDAAGCRRSPWPAGNRSPYP